MQSENFPVYRFVFPKNLCKSKTYIVNIVRGGVLQTKEFDNGFDFFEFQFSVSLYFCSVELFWDYYHSKFGTLSFLAEQGPSLPHRHIRPCLNPNHVLQTISQAQFERKITHNSRFSVFALLFVYRAPKLTDKNHFPNDWIFES